MKGYHILTLADIPLSTIHYINGHDVSYKGYASEEWKHLPLDAKKKQVMQEIIDFVGTLFPGLKKIYHAIWKLNTVRKSRHFPTGKRILNSGQSMERKHGGILQENENYTSGILN